MEIYGATRQTTDDDIIRRMPNARRITKATNIHSEYVKYVCNNRYAKAPQYHVKRILPVLQGELT